MSNKLKFFLGVLVLVALFSTFKAVGSLSSAVRNGTSNIGSQILGSTKNTIVLTEQDNDSDKDGLNDRDEIDYDTDPFNPDTDGDGFLDGEEVLSGYNPLEKNIAVETKQKKDANNLTTSYMQTMLGGLLAGDISLDTNDTLGSLVGVDVLSSTILEKIASKNLKISSTAFLVRDASPEEAKDFLIKSTRLLNIIPPQDKFLSSWDPESKKSSAEAIKMALLFEMVARKFADMEVPGQYAQWHKDTTLALAKASSFYKSLAYVHTDPILSLAQLELMPDIMTNLATVGITLNENLEKQNLSIRATFYEPTQN